MQKFYTYEISLKNYENKLSRIIKCISITELSALAMAIMASFNLTGTKDFYFNINGDIYECDEGLERQKNKLLHHNLYKAICAIPNNDNFSFFYDYEYLYEFKIKKIAEKSENSSRKSVDILSGVGFGLIEDNYEEFMNYLATGEGLDKLKEKIKSEKFKKCGDFIFDENYATYLSRFFSLKKKRGFKVKSKY